MGIDLPIPALAHAVREDLAESGLPRCDGIADIPEFQRLLEIPPDFRCDGEVHLGHPGRQDVAGVGMPFLALAPLQGRQVEAVELSLGHWSPLDFRVCVGGERFPTTGGMARPIQKSALVRGRGLRPDATQCIEFLVGGEFSSSGVWGAGRKMADAIHDVVVVGGGPGGYPAAIRARQLGLSVALVECEHLGGICLNWGCIPTKALLRSSEVGHLLSRLDEFGYSARDIQFDLPAVVKRSRKVAQRLATGVKALLKKNGVEVFEGRARLAVRGGVEVEGSDGTRFELEARNIILATGAHPRALPGLDPDGETVWTYREAMVPESVPASLLVVGAGAIGMEFASFYADLGADVTVVEALPRILPTEDEEISALAHKRFERRGIHLIPGARVMSLDRSNSPAVAGVETDAGESLSLEADRIILAVGIEGNVADLGLEERGVETDRGHIRTNAFCETTAAGIFAVGDVTGPPWLAHKATHEGVLAAERIAGVSEIHPLNPNRIPGCTYCRPQIASVGLSEAEARERGHGVRVGRFPFVGNGKAIAMGESEGLVKTIFDEETGELLGAHMIGAEVTEMIQGFVLAMNLETTEAEIMRTVFAHPTLSETMHESVLAAFDRAIHI